MPELLSHRGDVSFSYEWGVGVGLHSDWGGPLLDHFVTMLATLLLPIRYCMHDGGTVNITHS